MYAFVIVFRQKSGLLIANQIRDSCYRVVIVLIIDMKCLSDPDRTSKYDSKEVKTVSNIFSLC